MANDPTALPEGTHTVALGLGNMNGLLRGKRIPAGQWPRVCESGNALSIAMFACDMTSDVWDTPYVNMDNGYPDMHIFPGGQVYAVPWEEGDVGIPIEQSNPEYAAGQVEVNIRYGEALAIADCVVAFRSFVKEIARYHGFLATFMSKPFADQSGSGFHTHHSLWENDENAFADPQGRLSPTGLHYLAGMQERMVESALVTATTPNAYRRRRPYTFCPTNNAWGCDNRTVGLRVIKGAPHAVRVEKRDGSADCNPYYLIACELAAELDGIERALEPRHFAGGNGYEHGGTEPLATDLGTALELARNSEFLHRILGEDRLEILAGQAERELGFLADQVTAVEVDRYLRNF